MEQWLQAVRNWTRPSIQQPRWIANTVKTLFKPLTSFVTYGKDYWDTWNKVYKPEKNINNIDKKQ